MKKDKQSKQEQPETQGTPPQTGCGSEPKNPGTGVGEWQCRDGKWVWVQDIGG